MSANSNEPPSDPALDPHVRIRVQQALNNVLFTARDVLTRYSRDGIYEAPDPVPFGDVTGLIEAGKNQVLNRLQAQVDEARAVFEAVYDEIDRNKRERYGPGYKPLPRDP